MRTDPRQVIECFALRHIATLARTPRGAVSAIDDPRATSYGIRECCAEEAEATGVPRIHSRVDRRFAVGT